VGTMISMGFVGCHEADAALAMKIALLHAAAAARANIAFSPKIFPSRVAR
jgi:hypothetical protein